MRLVGPSSVDEMVLAFVSAEADGPRYCDNYAHLDRQLIDEPDITDQAQNRDRRAALNAYRTGFYDSVPADTSWQRWALTPAELGAVRYANYVTWIKLSGGTRRISAGAANVDTIQCVANGHLPGELFG